MHLFFLPSAPGPAFVALLCFSSTYSSGWPWVEFGFSHEHPQASLSFSSQEPPNKFRFLSGFKYFLWRAGEMIQWLLLFQRSTAGSPAQHPCQEASHFSCRDPTYSSRFCEHMYAYAQIHTYSLFHTHMHII